MTVENQELTCREVAESATELLEEALGSSALRAVEAHLSSCEHCRQLVGQLRETIEWSGMAGMVETERSRVAELVPLLGGARRLDREACFFVSTETGRIYLADGLSLEDQIGILQHLLDGCDDCSRRVRALAFPEHVFGRATRYEMRERPASEAEDAAYRHLATGLHHAEWESARARGIDGEHFFRWLIRSARNEVTIDPQEASRRADFAWEISREFSARECVIAAMLQGHVSRKVQADYSSASSWFDIANKLLEETGLDSIEDRLLLAQLYRMRGLSMHCQSRPAEADAYFEGAKRIYLELGEMERFGERVMDQAQVVSEVDSPDAAIGVAYGASTLLRRDGQPRNALAFFQNLAGYQARKESWQRALRALEMAYEELEAASENVVDKIQLDWTYGRILNAAGRFGEAKRVLECARLEFVRLGLASKTAWISLDLAMSLVGTGESVQLQKISEPMISYFVSRRLPTETLLAIRLFQEAVLSQTVRAVQVQTLVRALELGGAS